MTTIFLSFDDATRNKNQNIQLEVTGMYFATLGMAYVNIYNMFLNVYIAIIKYSIIWNI
ncbi:hypothetical protein C0J52_28195 [Blattella germanica]|nr:hypothetical protein C0J52_28195 [Blattella germanica]